MNRNPFVISPIVYLVDDDRAMLDSLSFILKKAGLGCTAFQDPNEFLESLPVDGFGCVIVDQSMPTMTGMEFLRELRQRNFSKPVIILTGCGTISSAVEAMHLGAMDYLEKPIEHVRLLETVNRSLHLDTQRFLVAKGQEEINRKTGTLTSREREVMELIADGFLTKQIASKLGIHIKTVEVHRSNLYRKFGVNSFTALVQLLTLHRMDAMRNEIGLFSAEVD